VSKQVAELEARLGVQLLQRTTRRLSVTDAGMAFYGRAKRILADLDAAEIDAADLQGAPRGLVRVGAPVAFGRLQVVPALPALLGRYPGLMVDLTVSDRFADLLEAGVDVAIRVGKLSDMSLIARHLGRSPRVAVAAPAYLAARGVPLAVRDLGQHACVLSALPASGDEWRFDGPSGAEVVRVRGRLRADNGDAARQAVLAGLGIGLLPAWLARDDLAAGRLLPVLPEWTPPAQDISALYAPTPHVASKVRVFIDHLVAKVRDIGLRR
jgi:DNA-binding transcriptional LysR family regulator